MSTWKGEPRYLIQRSNKGAIYEFCKNNRRATRMIRAGFPEAAQPFIEKARAALDRMTPWRWP